MGSITYDAAKNLITIVGYKDEANKTPWTPEDVYQASESNGWGVVDKLPDGRGYKINAYVCIGDGTTETAFKVYNEFVQVGDQNNYLCLYLKENATLQLGDLDGYKYRDGIYGGMLLLYQDYNSDVVNVGGYNYWVGRLRAYGSKLIRYTTQSGFKSLAFAGEIDFRDSMLFSNQRWFFSPGSNGTIRRTYFHCADTYFYIYTENITWTDIKLSAVTRNIVSGKNTEIRNTDFSSLENYFVYYNSDVRLYDCILPSFDILKAGQDGGRYYIYYSLRIRAVSPEGNPIENALVQVFDKFGNKVAEGFTDANGFSPVFELLVYYSRWSGPDTKEEEINYNPFLITVWKENYEQFILKTDIVKPTELTATMGRTGVMFGSLAFANRYEEGETVVLTVPFYLADGTPITEGTVQFKILKPDGTVVQDWTNATHLGDGVYKYEVSGLAKGFYIVLFRGEYQGMRAYGADTVYVVDDKKVIVKEIKKNRNLILAL